MGFVDGGDGSYIVSDESFGLLRDNTVFTSNFSDSLFLTTQQSGTRKYIIHLYVCFVTYYANFIHNFY